MSSSRTATNCKTCGRVLIDDERCLAAPECKVADLQRQLQQAQEEAKEHEDCPALDMNGECPLVNQAISEKEQAQEERGAAIKRAEDAEEGLRMASEAAGSPKEAVALVRRIEAAEALAKKYGGALEQFSLWLEQECRRGTLDLGFGPDWSAKKVQLALDRILALTPAEAQAQQEGKA